MGASCDAGVNEREGACLEINNDALRARGVRTNARATDAQMRKKIVQMSKNQRSNGRWQCGLNKYERNREEKKDSVPNPDD